MQVMRKFLALQAKINHTPILIIAVNSIFSRDKKRKKSEDIESGRLTLNGKKSVPFCSTKISPKKKKLTVRLQKIITIISLLRKNEPGKREVSIKQCGQKGKVDRADTKKKKSNKAEENRGFHQKEARYDFQIQQKISLDWKVGVKSYTEIRILFLLGSWWRLHLSQRWLPIG